MHPSFVKIWNLQQIFSLATCNLQLPLTGHTYTLQGNNSTNNKEKAPMAIAIPLHLLAAMLWVGGMIFAHQMLRPVAAGLLEPPLRQPLWVGVFSRFFPWVWVAIATLLLTGYWMTFAVFGGFAQVGLYVHVMHGLALLMIAIFVYVYFVPFQGLKQAVAQQAWPQGKAHLDRIRDMVGINMLIGILTIAIGAGGRYLL
jgi:uncharacterized membrane protein